MLADEPDFGTFQLDRGGHQGKSHVQLAFCLFLVRVTVYQLKGPSKLPEQRGQDVGTYQRIAADHLPGLFRRGSPENQRVFPQLGKHRGQAAVAHRWLRYHQGLRPARRQEDTASRKPASSAMLSLGMIGSN